MQFWPTRLEGAYLIDPEKREDQRGFFARLFCEQELADAGLENRFVQINSSLSHERGTLRGMHYQLGHRAEVKIVRCVRGALWDVILDLRRDSPSFGQSFGAELTSENRRMMYVPRGFAHGILTLTEDVEALYLVSAAYSPQLERGVRWNDPRFAIPWPFPPTTMSDKDANQRDFDPVWHLDGCDR